MQIEADVDESDIGQIRDGQAVRFTVQSYPGRTFSRPGQPDPPATANHLQRGQLHGAGRGGQPGRAAPAGDDRHPRLRGQPGRKCPARSQCRPALPAPRRKVAGACSAARSRRRARRCRPALRSGGGGQLRAIAVTKGESDGVSTVVSGAGIEEHLQVVSGIKPEPRKNPDNFFSFLRPPREQRLTVTGDSRHGDHCPA